MSKSLRSLPYVNCWEYIPKHIDLFAKAGLESVEREDTHFKILPVVHKYDSYFDFFDEFKFCFFDTQY